VAAAALCPLSNPSRAQSFAAERERMLGRIDEMMRLTAAQTGRPRLSASIRDAMGRVPRHRFVPEPQQASAYSDRALPIGEGQTISQPFIVALMTDLLDLRPDDRVLEIGTGLGYQAAVLAELAGHVYTVELIPELAQSARRRLRGRANVEFKTGNGYYGWPEHAPFDRIIVTAAPELIPPPLIEQLKPGGRMVLPAGLADEQRLLLVEMDAARAMTTTEILPVRFSELDGAEAPPFQVS
jgi:protein-L-isoaspartate(D-aspartate) O-methyltransferase